MPTYLRIIPLALCATCVGLSAAEDPPRLAELKAIYQRERSTLRAAAISRHIGKLEELQVVLTREGHLEDAQTIARKHAEWARELAKLQASKSTAIVLKPADARLVGELKLSSRYIRDWRTPGSVATWSPRGIPPGKYLLFLDYYPVTGGGGSIEVRDISRRAAVRIPPGKGSERGLRSAKVGTMQIGKTVTLRVAPRSASKNGVFLLAALRLVPTK